MTTTVEPKRDSMDATTMPDLTSKLGSTKLNSPIPTAGKPRPTLSTLPPSIRNKIYAYVLDTELVNVGKENVSYTHSLKSDMLHFEASRPPFPIQTSLFYSNKALSAQALEYFYTKNLWVKLQLYTNETRHAKNLLLNSGLLLSAAAPELVDHCTQHALDVVLVEGNSTTKKAAVMFPAQYLPRLVNFMSEAGKAGGGWASRHALFLTLRHVNGVEVASLQGDLLEGFRVLTGMGKAVVEGSKVLQGYSHGLEESMMSPAFEVNQWLACVRAMVDRGQQDKKDGRYSIAVQHCKAAIIALTFGYLTRPEELHSQPEPFHKSIQRLRYDIELTLGTSLLAPFLSSSSSITTTSSALPTPPSQLLTASTHITSALSLATDSPTPSSNPWVRSLPRELIPPNSKTWFNPADVARAWTERGKCHLMLGEPLFAAGDLERAERLLVGDGDGDGDDGGRQGAGSQQDKQEVEKWFTKARESIDWNVKPGMRLMEVAARARMEA